MWSLRATGFALLTLLCVECAAQDSQPLLRSELVTPAGLRSVPMRPLALLNVRMPRAEQATADFGKRLGANPSQRSERKRSFEWGFVERGIGFKKQF